MAFYAMIGIGVVAAIFAAGATWIVQSVSFKPMKTPRADNTETNLKDEHSDPKA